MYYYGSRSIARSPLMMGGDLLQSPGYVIDMLTNQDVLDVNSLGTNARQIFLDYESGQVAWKSEAPNDRGSVWVALFNTASTDQTVSVSYDQIFPNQNTDKNPGPRGVYNISCDQVDLWKNMTSYKTKHGVKVDLPRHGSAIYLLKSCHR